MNLQNTDIQCMTQETNPYIPIVLNIIPRVLTNLDRDRDSPTYGCFDRAFWNYKVQDFASAILQQCSLSLALIYRYPFPGNIYYNKEIIKEYAIAGIQFWRKIQHKNGSFDEYWRGEQSIPATAFTLFSVCETCDILGIQPDTNTIEKAVHFLMHHEQSKDFEALNQVMASIGAMYYAGKILEKNEYQEYAQQQFKNFLLKQKKEGWFSELGGLDLSYSTVNLDFLVRYYLLSGDQKALESAKRLLHLITYFVHPDGSVGGEYGTRNTEYFAPFGIEYLKRHCNISYKMIEKLLGYIHQGTYINLNCDERYYLHYLSHSFTKALLDYSSTPCNEKLPYETIFSKYFNESKIFVKSTPSYYFIANVSKGGVFKVMDKNTHAMNTDCGYRFFTGDTSHVTELIKNNTCSYTDTTLEVIVPFSKYTYIQQSSFRLSLLRLISFLFGFYAVRLVKRIMSTGEKHREDMYLKRKITFDDFSITIHDEINVNQQSGLLKISDGLSVTRTSSSRFFQPNVLYNLIKPEKFSITGRKKLERTLKFEDPAHE